MKVLLLTTHLNFGGIPSYIINLALQLNNKGITASIASGGGHLENKLKKIGICHYKIPILTKSELNPKLIIASSQLKKIVKDQEYSLIHANTRISQVVAYIANLNRKIPIVSTAHGFYNPKIGRKLFPCWGDKTIAISKRVKNHLIKDFKIEAKKIEMIYNGVDINRFNPIIKSMYRQEVQKEFRLSSGPVIGTISRFSEVKGIRFILYALAKLIKSYPDIKCLIAGDGAKKESIEKEIKNLGLENNVILVPATWQVEKILSCLDIFISASFQEGLGLSIIEAMGCRLPVIATKVGGVLEVISDEYDGLLIDPGNVNLLSEKIKLLLQNPYIVNKIAENARKTVEEKFNIINMTDSTIEVYKSLL